MEAKNRMRVCYVVGEIFGHGQYGGFGKLVRVLGRGLVEKGFEVSVITWQRTKQPDVELVDGMLVRSWPYHVSNSFSSRFGHIFKYASSTSLYKKADADVYISFDPNLSSYVAQKTMPDRKHVVYFQDPYDEVAFKEMSLVDKTYSWNTRRKLEFYAVLGVLRKVCHNADGLLTQANFFVPTARRLFRLDEDPLFLPNPVSIPNRILKKAAEPTVCFIGRWDPQKRVEKFFHLATGFPSVEFVVVGKSNYDDIDHQLRAKYHSIKNLSMVGFVSEEEKSRILEKSWIMVNTSIREGLPVSFLEAAAHKTAILSYVNPDNFASNLGCHVPDEDFEEGLRTLLKDNLWQKKGEEGYDYVKKTHEIKKVINENARFFESL